MKSGLLSVLGSKSDHTWTTHTHTNTHAQRKREELTDLDKRQLYS